jgi:hypothetical protein
VHTGAGRCCGLWIPLPLEELAKGEMLHDWELAQYFSVVHLQHALIDLSPAVFDAGDVEQDGRVLPKWTLLDIEDELDRAEVHVARLLFGDCGHGGDGIRSWCRI